MRSRPTEPPRPTCPGARCQGSTRPSSASHPRPTGAATGWWPPTAASSPSATPGSSARWATSRSTRRSSAWRRRPTAPATGWWRPTAASSPSATPVLRLAGQRLAQRAHRRHRVHARRRRLLAGGGRRRRLHLRRRRGSSARWATSRSTRPSSGIASTPDGGGYWLVAADGGVFTFGDAAVLRLAGQRLAQRAHRRASRPRPTAAATGWWRRTAASSPSATRRSRARVRARRQTGRRRWAWPGVPVATGSPTGPIRRRK